MKQPELKKLMSQNREEIALLYEAYGKRIKKIASSILHDEALAEDCLHNVILRISSVLYRVGEIGSQEAEAFIVTVSRHMALDMKKKKDRELCVREEDKNGEYLFDKEAVCDRYFVDENGFSEEINEYIKDCSGKERMTLVLRYAYDMTYAEIAELLGESRYAVEQRACRTRKKLKKLMISEQEAEKEN